MVIDATCTPADIRYPTNISLLDEARGNSEKIIDTLWNFSNKKGIKSRTYRNNARKDFLLASRSKRLSEKRRKELTSNQLNYIRRNLKTIKQFENRDKLSKKELKISAMVLNLVQVTFWDWRLIKTIFSHSIIIGDYLFLRIEVGYKKVFFTLIDATLLIGTKAKILFNIGITFRL